MVRTAFTKVLQKNASNSPGLFEFSVNYILYKSYDPFISFVLFTESEIASLRIFLVFSVNRKKYYYWIILNVLNNE